LQYGHQSAERKKTMTAPFGPTVSDSHPRGRTVGLRRTYLADAGHAVQKRTVTGLSGMLINFRSIFIVALGLLE